MMKSLNNQSVVTSFNSAPTPMNGGSLKLEIPQSSVMMAKPLSYDFRVVEVVDGDKIVKVKLQYQIWEHDNYGSGILKQDWKDVERIQLPNVASVG